MKLTVDWFGVFIFGVCYGLAGIATVWPQYASQAIVGLMMFELGLIGCMAAMTNKR